MSRIAGFVDARLSTLKGFDDRLPRDLRAVTGVDLGPVGEGIATIAQAGEAVSGTEFPVSTQLAGDPIATTIPWLAGEGFVAPWQHSGATFGDAVGIDDNAIIGSSRAVPIEFLIDTQSVTDQYAPTGPEPTLGGLVVTRDDLSSTIDDDLTHVSQFAAAPSENPETFATVYNPVSGDTVANETIAGEQRAPRITYLTNGNYVVTWMSTQNGGTTPDVYGRVFNANGTAAGAEFLLSVAVTGSQNSSDVTALAGGGFVAVWVNGTGNGEDIRGRIFSANGAALTGDLVINDGSLVNNISFSQVQPAVVGLSGGRFAVSWSDNGAGAGGTPDNSLSGIRTRVFNADGTPASAEAQVNTIFASFQHYSAISTLGTGYVVVWQDNSNAGGTGDNIRAQLFDANGARIGTEILITSTVGSQGIPAVVELAGGGFAVAWTDSSATGGDASSDSIKARIFTAAGAPDGAEFLVNATTLSVQNDVALARLPDGGFVATWSDYSQTGGDTSLDAVRSRTFSATGVPTGAEQLVNTTTLNGQFESAVASTATGYTVVFADNAPGGADIRFQRLVATVVNDAPAGTSATLTINEDTPRILAAADFGFIDINGNAFAGVLLTTLPASGTLTLNGAAVTAAGTFATAAQIAANALVFTPAANANGNSNASFTFQVRDGGGTTGGGLDTDQSPNTLTFDVTAQNDAPVVTFAAFAAVGTEIRVNTATSGAQSAAHITALSNGGFVVTWQDGSLGVGGAGGDTTGTAVKAQVFAAGGATVGSEIRVNTATTSNQFAPQITALSNGGFVVTWQDTSLGVGGAGGDTSSNAVKAQVFTAGGATVGSEILVNTATASSQDTPQITALSNGGFVVTWQDFSQGVGGAGGDTSSNAVKAQVFTAGGATVGSEILVNTATAGSQQTQQITALSNGGFVVTWQDGSAGVGGAGGDTSSFAVKAQVFAAGGATVGTEILVNTATANNQQTQQITALSNGGFVVTWQDGSLGIGGAGGDTSSNAVKAQVFTAGGATVGSEILVNTATASTQDTPQITALSNGGFVVTWNDASAGVGGAGGDTSGNAVKAQVFTASGATVGSEIRVNTATSGAQSAPQITALSNGGFVVTWQDGSLGVGGAGGDTSSNAVKAQVFTASGAPMGSEILVNTATASNQSSAQITALSNGGFVVTWQDSSAGVGGAGGDTSSTAVKAQVFGPAAYVATEQTALSLKGGVSIADIDAGVGVLTATLGVGYGVLNITAGTSGATIVSGNGTGSVVVSGTLAQLNALLTGDATSTLTFTPNTDAPPANTTLTVSVDDGGSTGAGGAQTGSGSLLITINAVNDAPVLGGAGNTVSYTENAAGVVVDAALTVADADSANLTGAAVSIGTGRVTGDALGFATQNGITGSYDGATGVLTLSGAATVADYQTALRSITFSSTSDDPTSSARTISFVVNDGAGANNLSAAATTTVNVTPVNDAPVFSAPAYSIQRISTASDGSAQATGGVAFEAPALSADGTKALFSSSAANLVAGDTNNTYDVFMKDLVTGVTTRLSTSATGGQASGESRNASFSPDGTKIIFYSLANDLVAGDTNTYDVFVKTIATGAIERVSRSSDGITINTQALDGIFSADGTKVAFQTSSGVFVRDLGTGILTKVSTNASGTAGNGSSYGQPAFSPDGTKILFNSSATNLVASDTNGQNDVFIKDLQTGAVTLVSVATGGAQGNGYSGFAAWSPDGTKVVFASNASNFASDANITRDVFVRDLIANTTTLVSVAADGSIANGSSQSSSGSRPVFSPDGSIVYFDSFASNLVAGDTNFVSDIFAKNLVTGVVTRVNLTQAQGQGTSDNAYDVAGSASGLITFRTGQRLVSSDTDNSYDAYVVTPFNLGTTAYVENGAPVAVVGTVSVSDVDSANYASGTFSAAITTNSATGDQLTFASSGSASGINVVGTSIQYNGVEIGILTAGATSLSVALDSDATDAAVKALTEAVRFASTSENPGSATRTVTFTLNDGGGTANGGVSTTSFTRTVTVVSVNDAPSGTDATITINEDTPRALTAADFGFSDVDGNALQAVVVKTLPSVGTGTLRLNGGIVTAGQVVTTAQLAANQLVYTPATNANGTGVASFTFQVRDNGGTANGGVDTDPSPNTIAFNITPVNDAPAGADATLTAIENTPRAFTVADFGFTDTDGNALLSVKITTLPGAGTLTLNGNAVVAGDFIVASEIAAGHLIYTPALNANGNSAASFTFQVRDNGGTANGGVDTDPSPNAITFNVTPVNDAPAGADATLSAVEDTPLALTVADFGFTDADGNALFSVKITTLPGAGTLTLNGNAVATGDFVAASEIAAGHLIYTPGANGNGAGYASFTFQVQDDGGTANGGVDTDQSANTLTFDVTAVNDAPTATIVPGGGALAPVGSEFLVNTVTASYQTTPSITSLANGGFVVTWSDTSGIGGDASGSGIKAQIYDATGAPVGSEFLVNTQTYLDQRAPTITGLTNGGFVVTWQDGSGIGGDAEAPSVKAQIFGATGAPVGSEFLVNTATASDQYQPTITSLADGGFVVTWYDFSGIGGDVYNAGIKAQIFGATGTPVGGEFLVNTVAAGSQNAPTITGLANGGFVVTWQDGSGIGGDASGTGIKAQIFGATGAPVGSEFLVNTVAEGGQYAPTITGLANGGFVVAWYDNSGTGDDADGYSIKARVFDATGAPVGGEFLVNTVTAGSQYEPTIASLANGGFVVTWSDTSGIGGDASDYGIKAQIFGPSPYTAVEQVALSIKGGLTVADVDAGSSVVTATLSVDYGVLDVTAGASGATIVSGNGTGTVVLSGTVAQLNALLNTDATSVLTYTADTDAPPGSTNFSVSVNDNGNTGTGGALTGIATHTISITPVNDAPVIDLNTNTAGINDSNLFVEGSFDPGIGSAISVSDVDGDTIKGAVVSITDAIAGDSISYNLPLGNGITIDPSSTATRVVLTGTASAAAYAQALGQFGYHSSSDDPTVGGTDTTRTITVTVNDGAVDSAAATSTITVVGVNDAPSGTDATINVRHGVLYTLSAAAFGFSDVENNAFVSVTVTTTPTAGRLLYRNDAGSFANVAVGQVINVADINAGKLVYKPTPGVNDAATGSFTFQVRDNGGTANGGVDTDQSPNTLTFTVPANLAPEGHDATIGVRHGTPRVLTTADFGFSDPDGYGFASVTITTGPTAGRLLYAMPDGRLVAVTPGQLVTTADIVAGKLVYKPTPGVNDAATGSFTFQVHDDGGTANGGVDTDQSPNTLTFTVPANLAPDGHDATIGVAHGTPYVLTTGNFGFSDPDGYAFASVTITTGPTVGRLLYAMPDGRLVAVTPGQVVTTADINAGKLVYKPTPGASDPAVGSFTFQVHDDGGTANGGVDTDPTPNTLTFDANAGLANTLDLSAFGVASVQSAGQHGGLVDLGWSNTLDSIAGTPDAAQDFTPHAAYQIDIPYLLDHGGLSSLPAYEYLL